MSILKDIKLEFTHELKVFAILIFSNIICGYTSSLPFGHVKFQGADCGKQKNRTQSNSFLWLIERDPPSYFFGTIHAPYTDVWNYVSENTKVAFDESEMVFFELDMTDPYTIKSLTECQILPDGLNVSSILPHDLYVRLKEHFIYIKDQISGWMTNDQKGKGLYADYLFSAIVGDWERKRPIWLMLLVNSLTKNDVKARGIPVLDVFLAQEAEHHKKHTGAVEKVEEHCHPLNELNLSQVIFALNLTLRWHEHKRKDEMAYQHHSKSLVHHYNCGDLNTVIFEHDTAQVPNLLNFTVCPQEIATANEINQYFRHELIKKRNTRMASRVAQLLHNHPQKTFFFAFGAGHFIGNTTVIDLLRNFGFNISHVTPLSFINSKHKHRHKHYHRGYREKSSDSELPKSDVSHSSFNDLWVRLDTKTFGPDSYLAQQNSKIRHFSAPSKNHNSSSNIYSINVLNLILILLFMEKIL